MGRHQDIGDAEVLSGIFFPIARKAQTATQGMRHVCEVADGCLFAVERTGVFGSRAVTSHGCDSSASCLEMLGSYMTSCRATTITPSSIDRRNKKQADRCTW